MANMMLELFSGTQSVSKVARKRDWITQTLDKSLNPGGSHRHIMTDVMDFNYRNYPVGMFEFIWASPPCTEYSKAKTTGVRKIDEANAIVERTLEIINYLKPHVFIIENPQTGLLKDQPMMANIPFVDVDYCRYGFPYRKRTRLWSNHAELLQGRLKPLCNKDCESMDESGKRHKEVAQRLPHGKCLTWGAQRKHTQEDLYKIPEGLVEDVLKAISYHPAISYTSPSWLPPPAL